MDDPAVGVAREGVGFAVPTGEQRKSRLGGVTHYLLGVFEAHGPGDRVGVVLPGEVERLVVGHEDVPLAGLQGQGAGDDVSGVARQLSEDRPLGPRRRTGAAPRGR